MIDRTTRHAGQSARWCRWLAISASIFALGAQTTFAAPTEVKASPPSGEAETWKLLRDDSLPECQKDGKVICTRLALEIENPGTDTLECIVGLVPPAADSPAQRAAVLTPKETRLVFNVVTIVTGQPDAKVECRQRPTPPPLLTPASCKPTPIKEGALEQYYPLDSRQHDEEGPVDVEYTLKDAQGSPSDIKIIGSSLSARLDEAAVRFIGDAVFTTPCPGARYRLRVRFRLQT